MQMGRALQSVHSGFDPARFTSAVVNKQFLTMELMDRVNCAARGLQPFLPPDYDRAVKVLIKAAPDLGEFENWILTSFVHQFGLDHFDTSVRALEEMTKHGTAEFAVRPFILAEPERMLQVLHRWALSGDEHVRRLAAEGSRPRGVWTVHLTPFKQDPRPVIKLLEKLKADPSLYVRKAVANNLNDISRDNPDLAIKTVIRWLGNRDEKSTWIVKRALRTLLKQSDPRVFALLGFTASPQITVSALTLSAQRIKIGGQLEVSFEVRSKSASPQRLMIDYRILFLKKSGKQSPKLFKLTETEIAPMAVKEFSLRRSFRNLSTRKYSKGIHRIEILINGCKQRDEQFTLIR